MFFLGKKKKNFNPTCEYWILKKNIGSYLLKLDSHFTLPPIRFWYNPSNLPILYRVHQFSSFDIIFHVLIEGEKWNEKNKKIIDPRWAHIKYPRNGYNDTQIGFKLYIF